MILQADFDKIELQKSVMTSFCETGYRFQNVLSSVFPHSFRASTP